VDIVLGLVVLAGLVWFWADSARAREQMLARCRRLCEEMNLQLLDQTVSLVRLRLGRGEQGQAQWRRWYAFEYSVDGRDRWRGTARLLGRRVESIHMEHPHGPVIIADRARLGP
jgi:hypothetical protein